MDDADLWAIRDAMIEQYGAEGARLAAEVAVLREDRSMLASALRNAIDTYGERMTKADLMRYRAALAATTGEETPRG